MNTIEKFKEQQKYRIAATAMALLFLIPSMVFKYNKEQFASLPVDPLVIGLVLQMFGLFFIILAYIFTRCPVCKKYAGNGWKITECKKCGERLA